MSLISKNNLTRTVTLPVAVEAFLPAKVVDGWKAPGAVPVRTVTLQLSGMRKPSSQVATGIRAEAAPRPKPAAVTVPTVPTAPLSASQNSFATPLDWGKRLEHLVNASGHNTAAALWSAAGEMLKGVNPQLKTGARLMRADQLDKADAQMAQAQAHGAITDPAQIEGAADVANYAVSLVAQSAVPLATTVVAARTLGAPAALLSAQVFNTAFNTHYQIHSTGNASLHQAAAAALPVSAVQVATGGLLARSGIAAWPALGAAGGMTTVGGQHLSTMGMNVMPGSESSYGQGAFDGALIGTLLGPLVATARPMVTFKAHNPLQLERGAGPKRLNENNVIDLPPGSWSRVVEPVTPQASNQTITVNAQQVTPSRQSMAQANASVQAPVVMHRSIHVTNRSRNVFSPQAFAMPKDPELGYGKAEVKAEVKAEHSALDQNVADAAAPNLAALTKENNPWTFLFQGNVQSLEAQNAARLTATKEILAQPINRKRLQYLLSYLEGHNTAHFSARYAREQRWALAALTRQLGEQKLLTDPRWLTYSMAETFSTANAPRGLNQATAHIRGLLQAYEEVGLPITRLQTQGKVLALLLDGKRAYFAQALDLMQTSQPIEQIAARHGTTVAALEENMKALLAGLGVKHVPADLPAALSLIEQALYPAVRWNSGVADLLVRVLKHTKAWAKATRLFKPVTFYQVRTRLKVEEQNFLHQYAVHGYDLSTLAQKTGTDLETLRALESTVLAKLGQKNIANLRLVYAEDLAHLDQRQAEYAARMAHLRARQEQRELLALQNQLDQQAKKRRQSEFSKKLLEWAQYRMKRRSEQRLRSRQRSEPISAEARLALRHQQQELRAQKQVRAQEIQGVLHTAKDAALDHLMQAQQARKALRVESERVAQQQLEMELRQLEWVRAQSALNALRQQPPQRGKRLAAYAAAERRATAAAAHAQERFNNAQQALTQAQAQTQAHYDARLTQLHTGAAWQHAMVVSPSFITQDFKSKAAPLSAFTPLPTAASATPTVQRNLFSVLTHTDPKRFEQLRSLVQGQSHRQIAHAYAIKNVDELRNRLKNVMYALNGGQPIPRPDALRPYLETLFAPYLNGNTPTLEVLLQRLATDSKRWMRERGLLVPVAIEPQLARLKQEELQLLHELVTHQFRVAPVAKARGQALWDINVRAQRILDVFEAPSWRALQSFVAQWPQGAHGLRLRVEVEIERRAALISEAFVSEVTDASALTDQAQANLAAPIAPHSAVAAPDASSLHSVFDASFRLAPQARSAQQALTQQWVVQQTGGLSADALRIALQLLRAPHGATATSANAASNASASAHASARLTQAYAYLVPRLLGAASFDLLKAQAAQFNFEAALEAVLSQKRPDRVGRKSTASQIQSMNDVPLEAQLKFGPDLNQRVEQYFFRAPEDVLKTLWAYHEGMSFSEIEALVGGKTVQAALMQAERGLKARSSELPLLFALYTQGQQSPSDLLWRLATDRRGWVQENFAPITRAEVQRLAAVITEEEVQYLKNRIQFGDDNAKIIEAMKWISPRRIYAVDEKLNKRFSVASLAELDLRFEMERSANGKASSVGEGLKALVQSIDEMRAAP